MACALTCLELEMAAALDRCANLIKHLLDVDGPSAATGRFESETDPTLEIVRAILARADALADAPALSVSTPVSEAA